MFSATVITGTSMKCWCTMPIPRRMASARTRAHRLAVDPSRRRRAVEPEEDAHQRGLAGAVLAQQRVDLARHELEGDASFATRRRTLGDPTQFTGAGCSAIDPRSAGAGTTARPRRPVT